MVASLAGRDQVWCDCSKARVPITALPAAMNWNSKFKLELGNS